MTNSSTPCSLLVFDNVENGSLKDHLNGICQLKLFLCIGLINFGLNGILFADPLRTPLNWRTRLQIANGVAAALVSHGIIVTVSFNFSFLMKRTETN